MEFECSPFLYKLLESLMKQSWLNEKAQKVAVVLAILASKASGYFFDRIESFSYKQPNASSTIQRHGAPFLE